MFNTKPITKMDILAQKEQQIETQRETIATLRETIATLKKSVERLETELRKCLEPGRDDVRPEAASLQFTKNNYVFNFVAEQVIASVFQPVHYFIPDEGEKDTGHYAGLHKVYTWENFQNALFNDKKLDDGFWTGWDFRHGLAIVTKCTQELRNHYALDESNSYKEWDARDLAGELLYDRKAAPAFDALLEALQDIDRERWFDDKQFDDLLLSLHVLSFILKLGGTVITDDEEEEKEA